MPIPWKTQRLLQKLASRSELLGNLLGNNLSAKPQSAAAFGCTGRVAYPSSACLSQVSGVTAPPSGEDEEEKGVTGWTGGKEKVLQGSQSRGLEQVFEDAI